MRQYEDNLARLYSVLINIVKLARLYGVSLDNINKEQLKIVKLSKFSTIDEISDFIRGYAKDVTKNIMTNMSVQQSVAYELTNKIYPRLLDECTNKTNKTNKTNETTKEYVSLFG